MRDNLTIALDFDACIDCINGLMNCKDIISDEQEALWANLNDLHNTFDDPLYYKFEDQFRKGDEEVKGVVEIIYSLSTSIAEYAKRMQELA